VGDEVRCADFVGLSSYGTAACSVVDAVSVRAKVDELVGPDYEAVGGGGGAAGDKDYAGGGADAQRESAD